MPILVARWDAWRSAVILRPAPLWRVEGSLHELGFSSGNVHMLRAAGVRALPQATGRSGYQLTWARDVRGQSTTSTHSVQGPVGTGRLDGALHRDAFLGTDVERLDGGGGGRDEEDARDQRGLANRSADTGGGMRLQAGTRFPRQDDYARTAIGAGIIRHIR